LVFAEGARLYVMSPLPGQDSRFDLASAGVGLRLKWSGLSLDLDLARAFTTGYITRAGDDRVLFRTFFAY
jgi:hemolysin activation/secretion protein